MNIHLPAILMFTRGTRFWHTAIEWSMGWKLGSLASCRFLKSEPFFLLKGGGLIMTFPTVLKGHIHQQNFCGTFGGVIDRCGFSRISTAYRALVVDPKEPQLPHPKGSLISWATKFPKKIIGDVSRVTMSQYSKVHEKGWRTSTTNRLFCHGKPGAPLVSAFFCYLAGTAMAVVGSWVHAAEWRWKSRAFPLRKCSSRSWWTFHTFLSVYWRVQNSNPQKDRKTISHCSGHPEVWMTPITRTPWIVWDFRCNRKIQEVNSYVIGSDLPDTVGGWCDGTTATTSAEKNLLLYSNIIYHILGNILGNKPSICH